MSTMWDAPNQQVVRADESPPWEEGTGNGGGPDPQAATATAAEEPTLDTMTKAQLLDHAQSLGLDVDDSMTKADIRQEIEAH